MKPNVTTRVSPVVDQILTIGRTIPDLTVIDGPSAVTPTRDVLEVGVGEPSFYTELERLPGLRITYRETLHVVCSLWSWSGSVDIKPRRDRVSALIGEIDLALRAATVVEGVWDRVNLGEQFEWQQGLTDSGAAVSLGFVVVASALI